MVASLPAPDFFARRPAPGSLGSLPVTTIMERLQVGLLAWDPVLHELEKRYSTRLDARLRFKGVWCPSRRDDLVQAVWYRLWRRCSKPEGWKPGKGKDPLWTLIKKIADNLRLDLNRRRRTHEKHWAGYCEAFSQFYGGAAASVPARTRQPGERAPRGPRVQLVAGMTRRERARLEREALVAFQELPARKQKILLLVADGQTTRQIGEKIDRSPGRVSIDLNGVRREVIEQAKAGVDGRPAERASAIAPQPRRSGPRAQNVANADGPRNVDRGGQITF